MNPYLTAAVDSEIDTLRRTTSGRACAAFKAAAALGNLVGSGELDRSDTEGTLLAAALDTGLPQREALGHIRRGIRWGERTPRSASDRWSGHYGRVDALRTQAPTQTNLGSDHEMLRRPPKTELASLWADSVPVSADRATVGWFVGRYAGRAAAFLENAELWDLARVIPAGTRLPRWAWSGGGSWIQTGHRLLFRLWDHRGEAVSVRARCLDPATSPKSLAPSSYSVKGLVLVDPLGVQLLAGHVPDWWEPKTVVIAEGEPDWLLWAASQRETDPQGPAVFGIDAGSWSQQISDRIPDGARVAIRTHNDEPGERYALQIAASLRGRCRVFRSKAGEEEASK